MYFCEATTWIWAVRHLGVGSWDPLVRQKWRQIWKLRLRRCRLHDILLYNIYTRRLNMPSGVHTIFAHAPLYLCTYNHMFGAGGIWRASRQEQQRIWVAALSFGRIWVDTMHLALDTHFSKYLFFKNCCNRRKCKSFFVLRQDSHAAGDRFPQNLGPSDTLVNKQSY